MSLTSLPSRLVSMMGELCRFVPTRTRNRILERLNYELHNKGQRGRFRSINSIQTIFEKDGFTSLADAQLWSRTVDLDGVPLFRILFDTPTEEEECKAVRHIVLRAIPHFQASQKQRPFQTTYSIQTTVKGYRSCCRGCDVLPVFDLLVIDFLKINNLELATLGAMWVPQGYTSRNYVLLKLPFSKTDNRGRYSVQGANIGIGKEKFSEQLFEPQIEVWKVLCGLMWGRRI